MYKGMNKSKLRKIHPLPLGEGRVRAQDLNRLATLTQRFASSQRERVDLSADYFWFNV